MKVCDSEACRSHVSELDCSSEVLANKLVLTELAIVESNFDGCIFAS